MAILVDVDPAESSQIRACPVWTVPVLDGVAVEHHTRGALLALLDAPSVVFPNVDTGQNPFT